MIGLSHLNNKIEAEKKKAVTVPYLLMDYPTRTDSIENVEIHRCSPMRNIRVLSHSP